MRRSTITIVAAGALAGCAPRTLRESPERPSRAPASAATDSSQRRFVDSLLARMTLEEKVGQLTQLTAADFASTPDTLAALIARGEVGSLMDVIGADTTRALQRLVATRSRLRVPLLFADDVIHGFRTDFPIPLAEASSWDTTLASIDASVAAREAAAAGIRWTYAPMVDVARDPRWGRIMEGSGEDPFLGAAFAAARVRGFQGSDLALPSNIAATAKHFAAYGAAEGGRDYNSVDVSERTLREVYLPPFRSAVCAGAQTIMASFNEIGGVPSHANRALLRGVLRDEWGFDGVVVSDWNGVGELIPQGVAVTSADAASLALDAGIDIDMVSRAYARELPALVRARRVRESDVDAAVRRVLALKLRLGLFADAYRHAPALPADSARAAARRAAAESMVLLENRGALLPLGRDARAIAVVGALAADTLTPLGSWSDRAASGAVSVLEGVRHAVSPATRVVYAAGASPTSDDTTGIAAAVAAARESDVVVLVVGEPRDMTGEASSRATLDLPGAQQRLADALARTGKPIVAVVLDGRPLALGALRDDAAALLQAWYPGTEAGTAIADVLFGDVNPSAKLPASFPRSVGQVPLYAAHKNTGRPPSEENRYSSRYIDEPWTPLYPFGYGSSYTTFALDSLRRSAAAMRPGDTLVVTARLTNTGSRAGADVVQLYLRDDVASVTRPVQELRGFARVALQPGESRTVRFTLDERALALHDTAMRRVVEPGTFTLWASDGVTRTPTVAFRFDTPDGAPVAIPDRCPSPRP